MSGRTEGDGKEYESSRLARQQPKPAGLVIFPLSNSTHALAIALPFGSVRAEKLAELAREAAKLSATEIRPAPGRMLLVLGLTPHSAIALQKKAAALGFVTDAADPRLQIAACPGKPACASGHIETRAIAEQVARRNAGLLDGSFTLHVSGCAKGCAHPGPAALALVGGENRAGLVVNGTAGANPAGYTAVDEAASALGRVVALVARQREPGETAAACLARLGASVAQAFAAGPQE
jgi:precorrin-3B synthase